jgi:hypothetical protein
MEAIGSATKQDLGAVLRVLRTSLVECIGRACRVIRTHPRRASSPTPAVRPTLGIHCTAI